MRVRACSGLPGTAAVGRLPGAPSAGALLSFQAPSAANAAAPAATGGESALGVVARRDHFTQPATAPPASEVGNPNTKTLNPRWRLSAAACMPRLAAVPKKLAWAKHAQWLLLFTYPLNLHGPTSSVTRRRPPGLNTCGCLWHVGRPYCRLGWKPAL